MERVTNTETTKNAIKAIEAGSMEYKRLSHKPLCSKDVDKIRSNKNEALESNNVQQKGVIREVLCRKAYKEVLDIIKNLEEVKAVTVHEVYEGDKFEYCYGLEERLIHIPCGEDSEDKITDFYACCKLKDGTLTFVVMTKNNMDRNLELNKKSGEDLGNDLCKNNYILASFKVVLLKLLKYMPIVIEEDVLNKLIEI